jgi:hypothetical protein
MKRIFAFFLFAALAFSQPTTLRTDWVTPTQAVVSYAPPDANPCTIEVSTSNTYSPQVHDTNSSLFSGSNSDASRARVVGSRRNFIVGTRTAALASDGKMRSRALTPNTTYYVRMTCTGGSATTSFTTAKLSGLAPEAPPYSADGLGGFGFPEFDYADRSTPVVDPQTGTKMYMVANPKDLAHVGEYSFVSGIYFGGTGWTNPGNITAASAGTVASTSGTNPIFVPMKLSDAYILGNWSNYQLDGALVDAALHIYGQGTGAAGDRKINVCLSVDSGQTCYTSSTAVTLSTSSTDQGTFPSDFPTAGAANATWIPFKGWGKTVPRNYTASGSGNLSATAGAVTVTVSGQSAVRSYFNAEWAAGTKVYIAGSSPTCANNFCTIASVTNSQQMTLSESLTISSADWYFAGIGFRITKDNSSGSVALSAAYKIAKSYAMETGSDMGCSPTTVTTNVDRDGNPISPGIVGRLCLVAKFRAQNAALYFVGETQPEFRLLSLGRFPTTIPAGHTSDDWVYPPVMRLPASPTIFDTADANTFYIGSGTNSGSTSIFKGVYSGDYRETSGLFFIAGNDTGIYTYVDDSITWTNMTKPSASQDLRTRILAGSSYNESLYGSLTSGLSFVGIASNYAVFYKGYGAQDDACWIFTFNASTGALASAFDTAKGPAAGARFGGCHAALVQAGKPVIGNNGLKRANTSTLYGGPFTAVPTHVYRSGSPSTTTSLPGTYDASYDGTCPADLPQKWKDKGAVGNNCVKLRFATEPCSSYATTAEKAATPCPGDATKSYIGVNVGEGDEFYDPAQSGDGEHMLIVRRTAVSGNTFDVIMLRNAGNGYCCIVGSKQTGECLGAASQAVHSNGWTALFVSQGSCESVSQFYSPTDPTSWVYEHQMYMRGHYGFEVNGSVVDFIGIQPTGVYAVRHPGSVSDIGVYGSPAFDIAYTPSFSSVALNAGVVQSYASPGINSGVGVDWRHVNGGLGLDVEIPNQSVGPALTITSVGGQSRTYKVTGFTAPTIKKQPLVVWMGIRNFADMSSATTGNRISDSDLWKYCYAYRANECRTGSNAGDLYVVAAGLDTSATTCSASQVSRNVLCVFPVGPGLAQIMQLHTSDADSTGAKQRRLGPANNSPGSQYVYSHARPFSPTQPTKLFATAYHQSGVHTGAVMLDPGAIDTSAPPATDYVTETITVPASGGATHARIKFGYADYSGDTSTFNCTSRDEACVTDESLAPFAFVGDSLTAKSCSSGCSIGVPAIPGRVMQYKIEYLSGGSVVSSSAVDFLAADNQPGATPPPVSTDSPRKVIGRVRTSGRTK